MGLKSILKTIGGAAPLLTKLLPIPGAGIAGDLIASALGVQNTPQSIEHAIQNDPEALAKIKLVEEQNKPLLQQQLLLAETTRIQAVNQTMQAESRSEHWMQYSWRPFWGFVSAVAFLLFVVFVCYLALQAIRTGNMSSMTMVPQLISSAVMLFGIPMTILGVASLYRGKEKLQRAGAEPTAPGGLIGRLLGKQNESAS